MEGSAPNVVKGDDHGGVASKKRHRSRPDASTDATQVIEVPEAGSNPPHKKTKASKDGQRKSASSLNLDNLTEADFDCFKQDPLLFSADVCKAAASLITKLR